VDLSAENHGGAGFACLGLDADRVFSGAEIRAYVEKHRRPVIRVAFPLEFAREIQRHRRLGCRESLAGCGEAVLKWAGRAPIRPRTDGIAIDGEFEAALRRDPHPCVIDGAIEGEIVAETAGCLERIAGADPNGFRWPRGLGHRWIRGTPPFTTYQHRQRHSQTHPEARCHRAKCGA